ncbi:ANTAR domain-containing response regulator [Arhodomonas sp. AD133]|uniref:ANTAR domain-containing response regulator n=1 Tax=Arhodomonas sp. AD133 TaxID=3415009 RepID=UPI003EBA42AD
MTVRVLLVDASPDRGSRLHEALVAAGYEVLGRLSEGEDLHAEVAALEPDAVIVDAELPSRDTLEQLAQANRRYPRPTVVMSERADTELTRDAARAGVSVYAVEGLEPELVRSLVEVAMAQFQAYQRVLGELARAHTSLTERKVIDQAKCLLMERRGIGEAAAYEILRKAAMDRRRSLYTVARELIDAAAPRNHSA